MSVSADRSIDRLAARRRPIGRPCGYHTWRDLLFLHWKVPAELIVPALPPGLTLDTWNGDAWIGLVPFAMRNIRPWWSPPVPGISNFLETNLRTYVHRDGRDPGVWFFSLDASSRLAVWLARTFWHLNYRFAHMSLTAEGRRRRYSSSRPSRTIPGETEIEVELPDESVENESDEALPGTLEFFLVERYVMYAYNHRANTLLRGHVFHPPYRSCKATVNTCRQSLASEFGIGEQTPPDHALYSPGVDVEVFPLRPVAP